MRLFPRRRNRWRDDRRAWKDYRNEILNWTAKHFREAIARTHIVVHGLVLSAGPIVYWRWEAAHHRSVDALGLVLAAVIPVVILLSLIWLWYSRQAPMQVWRAYKTFYDSHHPPLPWTTSADVHPDDSGITFRLLTNGNVEWATRVSCVFHLYDRAVPATKSWQPGRVSPEDPLELVYPTDFRNPDWPLPPGYYEAVWCIESPSRIANVESPVTVKRPSRRWTRFWAIRRW
jgi:hypothetical protein